MLNYKEYLLITCILLGFLHFFVHFLNLLLQFYKILFFYLSTIQQMNHNFIFLFPSHSLVHLRPPVHQSGCSWVHAKIPILTLQFWQELTNRQMLSLLNRPLFSHTIRFWYSLILIKIISYTWFQSDVLFPLHHQSHFLHSWNSLCWSSLVLFLYV